MGISASRILHLQDNSENGIASRQMACPVDINVDSKLQHGSGIDLKCYWVIESPTAAVPGDALASQFYFISEKK